MSTTLHHYEFILNSLPKKPTEVSDILEDIKQRLKAVQLRGISFNLELNNLE
jgi:hypothetical protein